MSDYKKDLEEIEAFLSSPSPLGEFARRDEPFYQVLRREVESTGRVLAKCEYVYNMRLIEHRLATVKLEAFVKGITLPKDQISVIEEEISNFITEHKKGVWS